MTNIKNLPVVEQRLVEFSEELELFIREKADGLPLMGVVGSMVIVKQILIDEALEGL